MSRKRFLFRGSVWWVVWLDTVVSAWSTTVLFHLRKSSTVRGGQQSFPLPTQQSNTIRAEFHACNRGPVGLFARQQQCQSRYIHYLQYSSQDGSADDDDERLTDDDCCDTNMEECSYCNTKQHELSNSTTTNQYYSLAHDGFNRRDFVGWVTATSTSVASTLLYYDPFFAGKRASATPQQEPQSTYSQQQQQQQPQQIMVPPFSTVRRYKRMVLSNGLRVLLVSDRRSALQAQQQKKTQQQSFPAIASAALTIGGAGQFSDPDDLPGLAHLMEHMVLGSDDRTKTFPTRRSPFLLPTMPPQDLEDWLSEREGSSNGYTAYDNVCFHFMVDNLYFQETLQLFASLFLPENVERVCRSEEVLRREIDRVDSELDMDLVTTQAYFLTKQFVNSEHPYSRFGLGNRDTLERIPNEIGIDVSSRLIQFFYRYYRPTEAVLVVCGSQDLSTLARFVTPFAATLSPIVSSKQKLRKYVELQKISPAVPSQSLSQQLQQQQQERYYPGRFLQGGNRLKQMVLARKQQQQEQSTERQDFGVTYGGKTKSRTAAAASSSSSTIGETLTMEWILNLDYTNAMRSGEPVVTGAQIAFLLSQILGRRSSGSLYFFLLRRGWVSNGNVPKFSVPVDVSGFQLLKLEIALTLEGFLNRSAVVVAVLDSLDALRDGRSSLSFSVPRTLVTSWATMANLFGYALANRPPDVIELAQDAQVFGIESVTNMGTGNYWYRFPSPEDRTAMRTLARTLSSTLAIMSDPDTAVVIVTAGPITASAANLPSISSKRWTTEPTTGGRFMYEDMLGLASRVEELVLTRLVDREELLPPVLNTLIPLKLRPPRLLPASIATDFPSFQILSGGSSSSSSPRGGQDGKYADSSKGDWFIALPMKQALLPMPRGPPEPTCRCVFVVQLLSSRPARAGVRQAAQGELFKLSFESALSDLGELGAQAGLAYDISYNKYGMRIAILGLSQNIGSYTRRVCRRLVEHSNVLFRGPEIFPSAITNAAASDINRARGVSPQRKRTLVSCIRRSTAYEAAAEGITFFRSVQGAVCFAQGDLLPNETQDLVRDVRDILNKVIGDSSSRTTKPAFPELQDIAYLPVWKPRYGSPCGIAGVRLIADACGRVAR